MKKLLAVLIVALLCAGMAAVAEGTYTVGVCQLVQHPALDAATQGFMDALTAELGDKVSEGEKADLNTKLEALKEALKGDNTDDIKAKQEELQKEIFAVSEKVYKAAAEAAQAAQGDAQGAPNGDNVYDADFTDVNDQNNQ